MLPPALAAGPTCNSVKSRTPFCRYLLPGPRGFTTAFCHRASAAAPVRRSPLFPLTWWGGGLTKIVPCPSLRVPADRARTPFIRPCVLPRVRSKPWSPGDTVARHTTCCHMGTIAARLLAAPGCRCRHYGSVGVANRGLANRCALQHVRRCEQSLFFFFFQLQSGRNFA